MKTMKTEPDRRMQLDLQDINSSRKEKEESEILEQISKNCEKSLEDVNPFDDTVCI